MKKSINVAVVDNGVDERKLDKCLNMKVNIDSKFNCYEDTCGNELTFQHGTYCSLIIQKYCMECSISSVKILESEGTGILFKLQPALEWCYQKGIRIINLSLGTTHFKDKIFLRKIINHYANKGLCIIAASSNDSYITYPASFSNVIGVISSKSDIITNNENVHIGIDILAPSKHEIRINNKKYIMDDCNSYAAPYVSALVCKIINDIENVNTFSIKKKLYEVSNIKNDLLSFCTMPDWISKAYFWNYINIDKHLCYFEVLDGIYEDIELEIDTIITDSISALDEIKFLGKNIVYLGLDLISSRETEGCFWSYQNRVRQIYKCKDEVMKQLDIPIIFLRFDDEIAEFPLITQLEKKFRDEKYNLYIVSFDIQSALYDFEYIPKSILHEGKENQLESFFYWQTIYKKSDAILINAKKDDVEIILNLNLYFDIIFDIKKTENLFQVSALVDNVVRYCKCFEELNEIFIQDIYQDILFLLTEE